MRKGIYIIGLLSIVLFACRPIRKVQTIKAAITGKDTTLSVKIKDIPTVDSAALVKDILSKVAKRKIDFTTFNGKIKVDYEGQEVSQHVTAYVSIKKDSIILIQIKGLLGIVGMQVKVTKDSVILVNKVDKWIEKRAINFLQEAIQIPFDFYTLQDLIIGNPIFLDSNVVSYKTLPNQLLVLINGNIFKHLLSLDNIDFKVLHSKLDDIDAMRNRTCDITYSEFIAINNYQFATVRKMSVAEKSKLDVNLEYKDFSFNEPLKYHFSLPKNYKRR